MNINDRIRQYIKDNGWDYRFIANRAEYNYQRLSRQMNNKTPITVDEYELICTKGLKVDPSYFFDKKFLDTKNKTA